MLFSRFLLRSAPTLTLFGVLSTPAFLTTAQAAPALTISSLNPHTMAAEHSLFSDSIVEAGKGKKGATPPRPRPKPGPQEGGDDD